MDILSKKKVDQLKKQPIIESKVFRSQDGRYLIHRTSIIHIKPVEYYSTILNNSTELEDEEWF